MRIVQGVFTVVNTSARKADSAYILHTVCGRSPSEKRTERLISLGFVEVGGEREIRTPGSILRLTVVHYQALARQ
jgi:hypothetical protein